MKRKFDKTPLEAEYSGSDADLILIAFCIRHRLSSIHRNVVNDPDLTLNEKRAILASWASDACAIAAAPALRRAPGGKKPVKFDDVMEALRTLDKQATWQHCRTVSPCPSARPASEQAIQFHRRRSGHGQTFN